MDCNKCELFQPNYMYLDHVSSFLYDELLGMTEIFNNQVLELNKTALENMQNEAKLENLWMNVIRSSENNLGLTQMSNEMKLNLDQLEIMVIYLETLNLGEVKFDERSKLFSNVMSLCAQIDHIYQEFDEENRGYKEDFKKAFTFVSLLSAHLDVLSGLEQRLDSVDQCLDQLKETYSRIPLWDIPQIENQSSKMKITT